MHKDITHLFNKFAGKEVPMREWTIEENDGVTFTCNTWIGPVDPKDPTIAAMNKVAQDNGLEMMLCLPGTKEEDVKDLIKDNTVRAHIEIAPDGKWRIGNRFEMG